MNVIFDIGMVLIDFEFENFVKSLLAPQPADAVIAAMWKSGDWGELDRGVLTDEEVLQRFISHSPDYEREIRLVFARMGECPKLRDYAIPMIKQLKEQGSKVYYLSNYFTYLMHTAPWVLEFVPLTDGGVFSCFEKVTKPDPRIYQILCQRYSLDPKECVFVDDTLKNVQAAESLGIRGIHYTNQSPRQLWEQINS